MSDKESVFTVRTA